MKAGVVAIAVCLMSITIFAQTGRERALYERFRQNVYKEYFDFRNSANREYAEFVKRAWKQYRTLPAIQRPKDDEDPPLVIPEGDESKPVKDEELAVVEVQPQVKPVPQPLPPVPIKEQQVPEERYFAFTFYGTECKVRLDDTMRIRISDATDAQIAGGWSLLSDKRFDNLIRDCLELRIRYCLCDWAYLCMLHRLAVSFYSEECNEATLLMAYLYCQSGYKMRLARVDGGLRMLYGSRYDIYERRYLNIDGDKFYLFGVDAVNIHVCQAAFPKEQSMSLQILQPPRLAWSASKERNLQSERYPEMSIQVVCNRNLVDFYNTYPSSEYGGNFMTRWAMCANVPFDKEFKERFYPFLQSFIERVIKKEAVERLLNWVQTAFVYEFDDVVWGCDRAFFPIETLYYPYADCEDRSILFVRLVRDLLGLRAVLVYYPGHLAAAVCFDEEVNGDYIMLNGDKYIICDPTYIRAKVGVTMDGMNNSEAKVILLE